MRKLTLTGLSAITHKEKLNSIDPKTSEYYPLVQDIRKNCDLDITFIDEVTSTVDDISEAIPYLFDRFIKEENPHCMFAHYGVFVDKRYFHLISINKLIEKYKSLNNIWLKNDNAGPKGQLARLISLMIDKDDIDKIYTRFLDDENLGDTRVWFLDVLNKYKANQKFYDYLISHKDKYKDRKIEYGIYENNMPYEENKVMHLVINNILNSKKWKKFAEENK